MCNKLSRLMLTIAANKYIMNKNIAQVTYHNATYNFHHKIYTFPYGSFTTYSMYIP